MALWLIFFTFPADCRPRNPVARVPAPSAVCYRDGGPRTGAGAGVNPTDFDCVYCGRTTDPTRDHVPPRAVFPKPRPKNLVTVPACRPCNSSAAADDEYFAAGVRAAARTPAPAPDPPLGFGLALGPEIDLARVRRVVGRVVRGLYFRETGNRFRRDEPLDVHCNASLAGCPPELLAHLRGEILEPLLTWPAERFGDRVFEYRFWHSPDRPFASAWLLTFFAAVPFLVLTGPGTG